MVYRLFCLQSHYRRSLVFSWDNLDNAAVAYKKLVARIAALKAAEGEVIDEAEFARLKEGFVAAFDNDLNTSLGITALYDVLKSKANAATKLALIADFDRVLSLDLIAAADKLREEQQKQAQPAVVDDDPRAASIMERIAARAAAKKAKNYAEADRIRAELAAEGVTLVDTPQGTTYKYN